MENNLLYSDHYDFRDVPGSDSWIKLTEIADGDSPDRKYYVKNCEHQRFLLHVADCSQYDRKKNEFYYLSKVHEAGAPVPEPVNFGFCNQGSALYLQTRWIYGRPGTRELQSLEKHKQYSLGVDAGLCLKKVHHCRIPPRPNNWKSLQTDRINRMKSRLDPGWTRCAQLRRVLELIDAGQEFLAGRPQQLLHGGFQTDNLILSYENSLSMIDFENWQYGDPLADLATVLTQIRHISLPCAIGILDCYFTFRINDQELQMLRFYGALDLMEQLAGTDWRQNPEAEGNKLQVFLKDYQSFRSICPVWYKRMHKADIMLSGQRPSGA
ncbi:MAG TPA: hypothetical protein DD640_06365 [Clostridiales bacterium]|nr:hypothetical protein [Clostridiales bacterium]